ncbi:hypothetical protein DICVIV_05580 [Dictyocaulus viviparus]|uniref:Uncharacterized protein n=1 Tax=Dictyocaulus viviparus TaxID=29172 RepID=A0A0D8XX44_DICVI|nr:hypothetical protein DICVIV_05580 [Dictyocaulus viviparus]
MRSFFFACVIFLLINNVLLCEKFKKHVEMFCKFPGETNTCLTDNAYSFVSSCCSSKGGCNSVEFPKSKICCFTQSCLDRCYPGKGYRVGTVY